MELRSAARSIWSKKKDGRLRVTDHKTGKAQPHFGLTRNGEVLQPLLYAQAAESLLGKPVSATRLFYCTQRAGYKIDEIAVNDDANAHLWKVVDFIDRYLCRKDLFLQRHEWTPANIATTELYVGHTKRLASS